MALPTFLGLSVCDRDVLPQTHRGHHLRTQVSEKILEIEDLRGLGR